MSLEKNWGIKEAYHVEIETFLSLLSLAEKKVLNKDNHDGTFYHEIIVKEKKIAISTTKRIG